MEALYQSFNTARGAREGKAWLAQEHPKHPARLIFSSCMKAFLGKSMYNSNLLAWVKSGPIILVGRGGGEGYSTKFYTVTLRPEVQPRTLLYTIFSRKGTHFVYLLLTTGHPLHIPSLELSDPLNYYKCTFLKDETRTFSTFPQP